MINTLNTTFLTNDKVYSERGESQINSLKASYLTVRMFSELGKLDAIPSWEIVQFIKNYRDLNGGFSGDIYSVYSVVKTLTFLSPTHTSSKLVTYRLLTYVTLILTLVSLGFLFVIRGKVQKIKQTALERKAQTDRLTGLHNREFLEQRYVNYQSGKAHIALLLLDVDHFKSINDNYGHLAGDEVLIELAKLLSDNIRKTDTLARWGGEEFAVLCPATDPEHANIFAEKLRSMVASHSFSKPETITCSIGLSCSHHNEPLKSLFARADKALYESKNSGRNKVTYL
ncbi:GGDEF domain-containing protein [Kangiella sediminilitoris]|uniref:diguanylate cyclase n=1 Tax=Kangiella sediminilitoris TaxID=1144748 RepID=A0A1B3BD39_9GAMM|nr:GGDEF domain-containing protein [Kangiella sediminilitoris]AOE50736.1 diguanylate cyclase [Kangiella sediminilitoris]